MNVRTYRRATRDDLEFITTTIVEADKSGTPATLYERVFDLTPDELRQTLGDILKEEISGCELCCESFWLAVDEGSPVGGLATWVEGRSGLSSNAIRASLLSSVLGATRWNLAESRLRALAPIDIRRSSGAFQIESVYVIPAYRGRGVVGDLLAHTLAHVDPGVERAQVLVASGNTPSQRAFSKAGFQVLKRTETSDPSIKALFPGSGRVLFERTIEGGFDA